METLYVVMPAYNEEENIEAVIRQWYPVLEGKSEASRLVVADSGSEDRTHAILLGLKGTTCPKLELLSETGRFHGPKLLALYAHAIENGADFIFQTDSDGQTDPAEFEAFWAKRESYDGIFGNRARRGDGLARALVEKVACGLVWLYFGARIPDANAPFRLMRAETVGKYLGKLPEDYSIPNIMLTAYFARNRERVLFKEVSFKPRQGGHSSIDLRQVIRIGLASLGDFRAFRKEMRSSKRGRLGE